MVVLFMVLRDDTINQTMLVPMDLRKLIPKDHPCYFIKNVVDQIDCSEANREFADSSGEFSDLIDDAFKTTIKIATEEFWLKFIM